MERNSDHFVYGRSIKQTCVQSRERCWTEDFPYAGVSSLLLIIAQLHTKFSPLYLLALIPYFWRVIHSSLWRSVFLGTTLATSYVIIAYADNLLHAPSTFVIQLFCYNLIFVSYGIAVLRARKVFGLNPLLLLFLWLPIEYGRNHLAELGRLFALPTADANLVTRCSYGFHIFIIPFIVFLLNPLLLLLAGGVVEYLLRQEGAGLGIGPCKFVIARDRIPSRPWFYFPDRRAPPIPDLIRNDNAILNH